MPGVAGLAELFELDDGGLFGQATMEVAKGSCKL